MAPKLAPVGLSLFKPTAAELEAARAILNAANEKQSQSMANAIRAFLNKKKHSGVSNDAIMARGEERNAYLLKCLACQARKREDNGGEFGVGQTFRVIIENV